MQKTRQGKKKKEAKTEKDAEATESEAEEENAKKKPRIRIKLPDKKEDAAKPKRKGTKRKTRSDASDDPEVDSSISEPVPKKQKKKADKGPRKKTGKNATSEDNEAEHKEEAPTKSKPKAESKPKSQRSIFLNLSHWKRGRIDLDKSFSAARELMTSKGPWALPSEIPDDKFSEVALLTLEKMMKVDKYSVFAEPVTEDEAPGYFDAVSNPMDFGTMTKKVKSGGYGKGSKAAAKLYKDFLLVFDNCLTYNEEDGEIAEEASRVLGYVPEAYCTALLSVEGKK